MRLHRILATVGFGLALSVAGLLPCEAWGEVRIVANGYEYAVEDADGDIPTSFNPPVLNNAGQIAFTAVTDNNKAAVYTMNVSTGGTATPTIIIKDGPCVQSWNSGKDGTTMDSAVVARPAINAGGTVLFSTRVRPYDWTGVFRWDPPAGQDPAVKTMLLLSGDSAPSMNGDPTEFRDACAYYDNVVVLNGAGDVLLNPVATYPGGQDAGVFRSRSSSVCRAGEPSLWASSNFATILSPAISPSGDTAFWGCNNGAGSFKEGLFLQSNQSRTLVACFNDQAPDMAGSTNGRPRFVSLGDWDCLVNHSAGLMALSNSGRLAFYAEMSDDSKGVYLWTPGGSPELKAIALTGEPCLVGSTNMGTFAELGSPAINASGHVVFWGSFEETGPCGDEGVFLYDGSDLYLIAGSDDLLPDYEHRQDTMGSLGHRPAINNNGQVAFQTDRGMMIADRQAVVPCYEGAYGDGIVWADGTNRGGTSGFNDAGQVAFINGVGYYNDLLLATPTTLSWRPDNGIWQSAAWDDQNSEDTLYWSLGITPDDRCDITILPQGNVTVDGAAAAVTVKSLAIAANSGSAATLNWCGNGSMTVTDNLTIGSGGVVRLTGSSNFTVTGAVLVEEGGQLEVCANYTGTFTAGSLTVSGTATHAGGSLVLADNSINVTGGTLNLSVDTAPQATPAVDPWLKISANGSAWVHFNSTQHLAELHLNESANAVITAGGSRALVTNLLDIETGEGVSATLDLTNNCLIIHYGEEYSPLVAVNTWVGMGFAAYAWTGTGITSSSAANDVNYVTAVGVADNATLMLPEYGMGLTALHGEVITETSVVVRYTYWGDANLDGVVDTNDLAIFEWALFFPEEVLEVAGSFGWQTADFTYDDVLNTDDLAAWEYGYFFQDLTPLDEED